MNQAQLGEPAGLSLEQVQSYENAEESVSALDFFRIAAALGTKPPDLFPEPKK
jgi:transcriptional regulator with XRE-family HTH domain